MEVTQGANPFLMMSDDHVSPPSNMNPFLMDASDFGLPDTDNSDNPFLNSQPADTSATFATNPFAFDPMDYVPTSAANCFETIDNTSDSLFSSNDLQQTNVINTSQSFPIQPLQAQPAAPIKNDLMDSDIDMPLSANVAVPMVTTTTIQKPVDLDLNSMKSNDEMLMFSSQSDKPAPRRPPPPRPSIAPPSKETQDLILSVTGAMDATSSHLLDRIPPTRTPSPVSMRDLHSPSPTPDQTFVDLLDVSDSNEPISKPQNEEVNLFDIDDSPNKPVDIFSTKSEDTNQTTDVFGDVIKPVSVLNQSEEDPFGAILEPSNDTEMKLCDINQNQTNVTSPPTAPHRPPLPPQPSRPPPPAKIPPQKPPPPRFVAQPPTVQQNQTSTIQQNQAPSVPTNNLIESEPETVTQDDEITQINITDDLMSSKILISQASFPQENDDIFEPELASTMQPVSFAESVPTAAKVISDDTFANSAKIEPEDSLLLNGPEDVDEANILEEKLSSPQTDVQSNNSNTNPFSFQEEILSNEPVQSNNNMLDDFMLDDNNQLEESVIKQTEPLIENNDDIFGLGQNIEPQAYENKNELSALNDDTSFFSTDDDLQQTNTLDAFNSNQPTQVTQPAESTIFDTFEKHSEEFDAFAAKFESAAKDKPNSGAFDPFGGMGGGDNTWGDVSGDEKTDAFGGFGADEPFDAFLSMTEPPPVPQSTPARITKGDSDSDEDKDFAVFIKPKNLDISGGSSDTSQNAFVPVLAPPPKSPVQSATADTSPRFNPFDQQEEFGNAVIQESGLILPQESAQITRTDSQETPPTPLFDEDTSEPLEDFPRVIYKGEGWEMQLRQPNKKKITGQRYILEKIFLRLVYQGDNPVIQLFNAQGDKDPFQELPLQACYSVSEIGAQQYDQYGKIFTVKLQYIFYKERPGVRPGQVTKAERITNKLSQFAAYAIQGDYQGVKEFGSDLKKLGLPVEHAPQISQLFKIGSQTYEHMKEFSSAVEEALFRLTVHRDRALHYKMEEVQITVVDELYVEQNAEGGIDKQIARVRLFFLGFLSGMPDIELGVNDMRRQGKEVVGRHDIIPVVTEEWIRFENVEFHACVQQDEYHKCHIIKFKPPDACYIELMRFRIRPPKNRELPLQLKAIMCVTGNRVELRADVLVPGFASRKLGQVPCEDVMIRFPIPECWIYLFRVEKHFRYGSVKSAHRRTGKIKGIERFLGTVETLQESLIEVTSGQAKYEHQHRAIVWRCPRLPKEGQGAYTTHNLVCRLALTSYDQVPEQLAEYCYVEFTMPATQVSHTTARSVSVQGSDSDEPPEKYVRYLARHEYRVGIEHTKGEGPAAYIAATTVSRTPVPEQPVAPVPAPVPEAESSDSDSD